MNQQNLINSTDDYLQKEIEDFRILLEIDCELSLMLKNYIDGTLQISSVRQDIHNGNIVEGSAVLAKQRLIAVITNEKTKSQLEPLFYFFRDLYAKFYPYFLIDGLNMEHFRSFTAKFFEDLKREYNKILELDPSIEAISNELIARAFIQALQYY